jgi:hypothetical protein
VTSLVSGVRFSCADSMESVPGAVATGSLSRFQSLLHSDPVATALGTDFILSLARYFKTGTRDA